MDDSAIHDLYVGGRLVSSHRALKYATCLQALDASLTEQLPRWRGALPELMVSVPLTALNQKETDRDHRRNRSARCERI